MSAELDFYMGVSWRNGGVNLPLGSVQRPIRTVSAPGTGKLIRMLTLAPEQQAILWEYDDLNAFELLVIQASAYVSLAIKHDAQTSASDTTPAGTAVTWQHHDLTCHAPFVLNTDLGLTHATPADHPADDSGLPALWSDGDRINGRVYAAAAWNQSETDSVDVTVWALN